MSEHHDLVAGMAAGVAGLLAFLVIHHIWIKPIWAIAPPGLVIALIGGLAVGWSYREIAAGLPARPWTAPALLVLIIVMLTPGILLAEVHRPTLDLTTFTIPREHAGQAARQFFMELALPAAIIGAIAGRWLGHSWEAAIATALAGFVYAVGPGHNIPFLGQTPGVIKGLALLLAITAVASTALVEVNAWLVRKA